MASHSDIVCKPIDTLDELNDYMNNLPTWAAKCLPYNHKTHRRIRNCNSRGNSSNDPQENEDYGENLPKTLLCHDMANGYHDDRYVDGTSNNEAYHFYNWAAVDIFCYFSHHFITIPPLAWINAAHKHNVKVIGTIITEGKSGDIWNTVLASPFDYMIFTNALVVLTEYLNLQGWLLNIENSVSNPKQLVSFVKYFRDELHRTIPGAELIWYDSVTVEGKLSWQNALNDLNMDFFLASDGLFTNYSWTERDVRDSKVLATKNGRPLDLYIGIDVWGRHFHGGGKFNTQQAVQVAYKYNCSIALFAPAWTYEDVQEFEKYPTKTEALDAGKEMPRYEQFLLRDRALWDSLWPYLNVRVPSDLPFRTSFCWGNGLKQWRSGEVIENEPWHNLGLTEYQHNSNDGPQGYRLVQIPEPALSSNDLKSKLTRKIKNVFKPFAKKPRSNTDGVTKDELDAHPPIVQYKIVLHPEETPSILRCDSDAFNGGSSLSIKANEDAITLLHCHFECEETLLLSVASKALANAEQSLVLVCSMRGAESKLDVRLTEEGEEAAYRQEVRSAIGAAQLRAVQRYLLQERPAQHVPIENDRDWRVRYFILDFPKYVLTSISCTTTQPQGAMLLGHIGVCPMPATILSAETSHGADSPMSNLENLSSMQLSV